jgi:hypothetical protein
LRISKSLDTTIESLELGRKEIEGAKMMLYLAELRPPYSFLSPSLVH